MKRIRQILAIAGAALLVFMYLATLFCAIFDKSKGLVYFKAAIVCTILVPVLLWGYTLIYRLAKGDSKEEGQKEQANDAKKNPGKP